VILAPKAALLPLALAAFALVSPLIANAVPTVEPASASVVATVRQPPPRPSPDRGFLLGLSADRLPGASQPADAPAQGETPKARLST
jgi:hypothetical protein